MSESSSQPKSLPWWQQELALLGSYLAPRRLLAIALLLVLLGAGLVLAYQFPPAQYFVDVGAADDAPYALNFHSADFDGSASFRTSDYYSYVAIPGTGSLPYTLTLRLDGSNPTNATQPLTTSVFVAGQQLYSGRLKGGWQELSIAVNQQSAPVALAARDVVVELRSQTYRQPDAPNDDRGPRLDWVKVTPAPAGFIAPTVAVLLRLVLFAALLYLLLARLVSLAPTPTLPRCGGRGSLALGWLPLGLAAIAAVSLVVLMITAHQALALDSAILLITLIVSYLTLIATKLLIGALSRGGSQGGINHAPVEDATPGEQGVMNHAPTIHNSRFKIQNYLVFLIVLAFAIKFGGMALPQTIVKDLPWHIRFINVVKTGGLAQLMQPGVLSVTPKDWDLGTDALVPKSPLFYLVMAPLAWLPGDLDVWLKLVICLIDVSGAVILFYLARRLLPDGELVGLFAAAAYLLTPLSYQVLSFGTLPTIFAQWLTLLAFAWLLLNLPRLHRPAPLIVQSILFALVLLAFPTMVLFTPIVLGVMFIGGFFIRDRLVRRNTLIFMPLSGIIAAALAVLLYYGSYISTVLNSTLPAISGGTTVRGQPVGEKLGGWLGLLLSNVNFYGSVFPFILGLAGLILLFRLAWPRTAAIKTGSAEIATSGLPMAAYNLQFSQPLALLLLGWLLILPLFYVANYWVDMIGKHLLYTMYPLSLASGIALAYLWRYGRVGRWLATLLLAALGVAALILWLNRIIYAGR